MNLQRFLYLVLIISVLILPKEVLACLSITDDFNSPNPVINANFSLQPDVSPFTDCWTGVIKIRSDKNGWRLVASRVGPSPSNVEGNSQDNVMASDITLDISLQAFGQAKQSDAILVSPFSSQTDLSSIQSGTFVISGIKKSSNSCSSFNGNYYKVTKRLCLFRDFIFNPGEYNGQVSYVLVTP